MLLHVTLTCCCIRCYHTVTTLPCTLSYQFTFAFRSRNHHTETNIHHTFTTFFFKHHLIHHSHSDSPPSPPQGSVYTIPRHYTVTVKNHQFPHQYQTSLTLSFTSHARTTPLHSPTTTQALIIPLRPIL